MATSGSTDFSLSARQLITGALEDAGVIGIGATPASEESTKALSVLNLMLKTWGTSEALWIKTEGTPITLIASTASYVLSAARRVQSVRRRTSSIDASLTPLSQDEYADVPNKSGTGVPTTFYFDPQRATRTLYVWPAPDAATAASTTLPYTYWRAIEDVDSLDNDLDVPQEWFETAQAALTARLYVPFRRHIVDPAGYADAKERAGVLYAQLTADAQETGSVFFQPA